MRRVFLPATLAILGVAGVAQAHPKLLSASPAPNAIVARPAHLALRFSEKLMPKFSGADLMMTAHGGTTHPPMKVAAASGVADDGRTLVVTPKGAAHPGPLQRRMACRLCRYAPGGRQLCFRGEVK